MQAFFFYLFAALSVIGGVLMVSFRNPLSGAFALVLSLVSVAALFATLHAEFIFVLQILVYAGAIMVLIVFTIMLLNLNRAELQEVPVGHARVFVTLGVVAAGLIGFLALLRGLVMPADTPTPEFGSIEGVGQLMLSDYLYPFEVISLVLLVAVVGVVLLAKREI